MAAKKQNEKMLDLLFHGERDENGANLALIRSNLALSPEERLRNGDRATEAALQLHSELGTVTPSKLYQVGNVYLFVTEQHELLAIHPNML